MNASGSGQPAQLPELLTLVRDSKTTAYATVASLALLLFDYGLTFAQEVDLVWKRRLSWGKALFLITRYFGIFSHIFNTAVYLNNTAGPSFCLFAARFQVGSSNGVLWLVQFTLALRVWVLYNRSYAVIIGLSLLYLCSIATVTTMCVKALFHHSILARPGPFLSGCHGEVPSYFYNVLIVPVITTSVLLALTAYNAIRTTQGLPSPKSPMVQLLLRDGALYFLAIFCVLIVDLLVFHLARSTLLALAAGFFVTVPCMVGSRLFLNLREKLLNPDSTITQTLSTFRMRPYGPSIDITSLDTFDATLVSPMGSASEPDSATILVPEHVPWEERV